MDVSAQFECGNGKNVAWLGPGQFRIDEVGEKAPYCKYFCFRLQAAGDGGIVRAEVYPDPLLAESGRAGMMGHYPSQIWFSTDEMASWHPLENVLPGTARFEETHLSVAIPVGTGAATYVSSNSVIGYSRLADWVQSCTSAPGAGCERVPLMQSHEGRDVPALRLPATEAGAQRLFLLGGQHPSEHLGVVAVMGMVEFLRSPHPEAVELRRRCEFWAVPMVNVDGNVHGRNGWTMQDVNMFEDFEGAADGSQPRAVEDRTLWRWLTEEVRPDASLHFHGYMGKRAFIDPPYDGMYAFADPSGVYADAGRAERYRSVVAALAWDTDGLTGHGNPNDLAPGCLDYELARSLGTVTAFYEINHGYHGLSAAKRKGADVLRAMLRAYLR
ncbi:MAG: M14 family zinc carboxypeptidase [Anaerolineae bacterium]